MAGTPVHVVETVGRQLDPLHDPHKILDLGLRKYERVVLREHVCDCDHQWIKELLGLVVARERVVVFCDVEGWLRREDGGELYWAGVHYNVQPQEQEYCMWDIRINQWQRVGIKVDHG